LEEFKQETKAIFSGSGKKMPEIIVLKVTSDSHTVTVTLRSRLWSCWELPLGAGSSSVEQARYTSVFFQLL
jgi:hypothetical protein